MVTLGLAVTSEGIFIWLWGDIPVTYPAVGSTSLDFFGAKVLPQQLLVIGGIAAVFAVLHLFFRFSYLGKALTAAALNPTAARVCGIDTTAMGVMAFAVSSLLSGLAGLLLVPVVPFTPHVHVSLAINGFAAAVVGRLTDPLRGRVRIPTKRPAWEARHDPSHLLAGSLRRPGARAPAGGCSLPPWWPRGGISREADDFYFEPKEIRAQAGQPLTIRIENEGRSLHTFIIESLGVDVELQPGQERTVTITPTGTVTFVCRLHLAQGMTGQITVGQ